MPLRHRLHFLKFQSSDKGFHSVVLFVLLQAQRAVGCATASRRLVIPGKDFHTQLAVHSLFVWSANSSETKSQRKLLYRPSLSSRGIRANQATRAEATAFQGKITTSEGLLRCAVPLQSLEVLSIRRYNIHSYTSRTRATPFTQFYIPYSDMCLQF